MLICKNIPTIINKLPGYCLRLAIMLICKNIPTIIPFHSVSKQCIKHVLICHAIIMMLFSHTGEL